MDEEEDVDEDFQHQHRADAGLLEAGDVSRTIVFSGDDEDDEEGARYDNLDDDVEEEEEEEERENGHQDDDDKDESHRVASRSGAGSGGHGRFCRGVGEWVIVVSCSRLCLQCQWSSDGW